MRSLNLSRCALSVCAAATLLTACGGSQSSIAPTPPNETDGRATHSAPAAGGAFSGAYSGSYTAFCMISGSGTFSFSGGGTASFIHASGEQGRMHGPCAFGQLWKGSAALASSRHPSNTIIVSLRGSKHAGLFICELFACSFSVSGGTGKFKNAIGTGTLTMTKTSYDHYSDTWSGTITY